MYALLIDFDLEKLQKHYPTENWRDAYSDVRDHLTARGFTWQQISLFMGEPDLDATRCFLVVQSLGVRFPWLRLSVRNIQLLRIAETSDLIILLDSVAGD